MGRALGALGLTLGARRWDCHVCALQRRPGQRAGAVGRKGRGKGKGKGRGRRRGRGEEWEGNRTGGIKMRRLLPLLPFRCPFLPGSHFLNPTTPLPPWLRSPGMCECRHIRLRLCLVIALRLRVQEPHRWVPVARRRQRASCCSVCVCVCGSRGTKRGKGCTSSSACLASA